MSIYKKLLEIQKEVKGLSKDKKSHNFEYVTGNKLLSYIKPLMDKHGLILKQEVLSIENTRQDYKTKYSEKSEILSKVMMKFTWVDVDTGDRDENLFGANGQNEFEKGLGSALTYGERYFILKYFHIATDEDDIDNPDRKKEEQQPAQVKKPNTHNPSSARQTKEEQPKFKKVGEKGFKALIKKFEKDVDGTIQNLINNKYKLSDDQKKFIVNLGIKADLKNV